MADPQDPAPGFAEPAPAAPSAPRRRRSRWRTLGRVALGTLVALVLVLLLGIAFLHTGPGRRTLQAFVEKTGGAAAGGQLKLGSLDYRLWGGWLDVGAVQLQMEGTRLELGEAQLRWSPRGGLRLRLVRPNVVLRDTGKPKPVQNAVGMAARPWSALERLAGAELVDARVEMQDAKGVAYLVLGDVDATMEKQDGRRPIRMSVSDGLVGPPERRLSPVKGEGRLAVADGRLVIDSVHLDARGSTVDLSGTLDRLSPNEGSLKLRADADGALAAIVAPETEVKGRLRAQADMSAKETMSGTFTLDAPALTVQGIGPWQATLRSHFDSSHLVIERGELLGYGGRFTVDGPVALADASKTDLNLRAEGFDVAALGAAAAQSPVPVRSRLRASLRYTLQGWDVNQGRAEGDVALAPVPALPPRRRGVPGVPVKGEAKVVVEGRRVRLQDLRVEAHNGLVVGDIAVSPELDIQGRYRAELPLAALPALYADMGMKPPATPLVGALRAEGEIGGKANDPVATVRLTGQGIATEAAAKLATASVEGRARYAGGRLAIAPLVVRSSSGGQARFEGRVPVTAKGGAYDLDGTVDALDLAPMLAFAGIEGSGPLNGRVRVEGPRSRPAARAELDARLALAGSPGPVTLSLAGSSRGTRVSVDRFDAALAGGRVHGTGVYDARTGAIEGNAVADALRVGQLPLLPPAAREIDGVIAASLTLSGTSAAPAGELRASLDQATLSGRAVPGLVLTGHSDGRQVALAGGTLGEGPGSTGGTQAASVQAGAAGMQATFLRGTGSLAGEWLLRLELDAGALPIQAYLDAFPATRQQQATATAEGRLVVDLPLRDPKALRFRGEDLRASGKLRELEWSTERFAVEGDAAEAVVRGLRLATKSTVAASRERTDTEREAAGQQGSRPEGGPLTERDAAGRPRAGGTLSVEGRVPIAKDRRFDLALRGGLDLALLRALAPSNWVAGQASLDLRVAGTAAEPDVRGRLELADGRGRLGALRVSRFDALVAFEGDRASITRFEARTLGGRVTALGSVPVRRLSGSKAARLHFELADLDLSRLGGGDFAGALRDPDSPSFFLSLAGDVEATGTTPEAVRARGRFTRLEELSPEGRIALAAPAEFRLENGRFVQAPLRLAGPAGTLELRAEAQLAGGPLSGSAFVSGPFDLRLLVPFLQDVTVAGPASIDLRAAWDPKGVRMDGGLRVDGGRLTLEQLAFTASQIRGEVRLLGDRATVDASAVAADGRITVGGGMTFGPQLVGPGELRLSADRVPISYPEGFRARATGTVRVAGDASGYGIDGEIGLTQAYYTAEFDQRRQSLDRLDWQLAALRGQESLTEAMPLDLRIRLDDQLRIRNSQAQLDVVGSLNVGGTMAQPVATGQVTLLEGGQLQVRRARIRTQQGRVELNGYPAGTPEVDFSGLTQVAGIEMDVNAQGSLDDLQLQITSSNRPDLSQTDLISVLLTGRTAQAAAAESGAIVSEELAAALGGVLQKGIGETVLVDVAPERSLLTDDTDPTQRFNVGTRLRQDLMVLYSTRLDGTEQRWIVDYNPRGGRLRFRTITEEHGTAFEVTDRVAFNVLGGRAPTKPKQENAKVASVRFEGELPVPEELLRKAAKVKVGNRYDPLRLEQAADRVRQALVKGGWRAATADATWGVAPGHRDSIALVLHVQAGPRVLISWTGDDPGDKVRKHAREAWPAYASPETASVAVARAARIGLRAQGYYGAKVEHEVRVVEGRAELALTVERGPKGSAIDVRFEGNEALPDEALLATLPKPGSQAFFEALEGRSNRLTGEARLAYARIGYLRARVGPPRQQFDPGTGRLQVTVPVRERTPSSVAAVVLPQEVREAGADGPELTLKPGAPFDVTRYLADRDAIASWYRASGWTEARLRGVLQPSGTDVVVRYEAVPGPRPRVNDVRVATDGRPREELLRRSVVLEPGELITPRELARSRERLSQLQIFRSVDVRPVEVAGRDELRDIVVNYTERPDLDIEYGIRYSASGASGVGGAPSTPDNGRIQLAGAAEITDPFGWGWRLRPYTYLMTNRYTYGAALESATFFGLRVRTQLLAFDDRDNRSAMQSLASRVRGFSVQQTRSLLRDTSSQRWHDRLRLQWGYANKDIQYSSLEGGALVLAGNRAFTTLSLIGDERDSFTDPSRGVFWTATSELSRRAFGSDVNYVRLYGQLFAYVPLPLDMVWAQGYRAGVVPGTNPLFLLENRFQAGGPTTVRGFNQNDLGPQTPEGDGLGGQAVVIVNQELRFPIWRSAGGLQLAGGLFWDAGNVWALTRDVSLGDLRHSVGGGLRVMFPFGPIRLEYAFVLNRRPGERAGRIVFGLGHAF